MRALIKRVKLWSAHSNDPSTNSPQNGYPVLVAKADAARDRGDWIVAADAYEAALAVRPGEAPIWVQLGNMSKEANNFARALYAYKRALDLRPNDADTHLQIGHLHKRAGDKAKALASYALANRLDPSNEDAASELQMPQAIAESPGNRASAVLPPPQAAPLIPKRTARNLSLNARVLKAKDALQELLRPNPGTNLAGSSSLDKARPAILEAVAALEKIFQSDIEPSRAARSGLKASPSIVFDVSDLIQYFRHHRLPTGIQRVQIEAISVALLRAQTREDVRVCCFTESADYWREVPPEIFLELCELSLADGDLTAPEWRELMGDLDNLLSQGGDFNFNEGAFLINIGTSWWLQNYFLQVREAKQRSNIRYAPFVHDMIPILMPEFCVEGLVKDFIGWAQGVYEHADFYFVNSKATQSDLIKVGKQLGYDVNSDRIWTVRLDADHRKPNLKLRDAARDIKEHRLVSGEYVLFVSTIEARKNHVAIFDAWIKLCKSRGDSTVPKLVCVGSRGWLNESVYAKLSAQRLRDKVVMLSNVSDEQLAILYRECLFSVFPSFYEGWGLPVTEALCYGKPVLVSRSSSLPEAGGEFADYFDVADAADLLARLEKLMFDSNYRQERERAIRAGFHPRNWQDIAEDFHDAVAKWSLQDAPGWKGAPSIELGRYYSFARNGEIAIHRGMQTGEMFRSGKSWWGANDWGCWLKPGPAEIAFTIPEGAGTYRISVGLCCVDGVEAPFDMTILPRNKIMGTLKPRGIKWVTMEFDIRDTGNEVQIVLEGFTRHEERPRPDLNPISVSIAVMGLFVCAVSDMKARMRFAEAVSLDDVMSLVRGVPNSEFAYTETLSSSDSLNPTLLPTPENIPEFQHAHTLENPRPLHRIPPPEKEPS
jgi:glycosyltransferase involved in cell wall biosynthesis